MEIERGRALKDLSEDLAMPAWPQLIPCMSEARAGNALPAESAGRCEPLSCYLKQLYGKTPSGRNPRCLRIAPPLTGSPSAAYRSGTVNNRKPVCELQRKRSCIRSEHDSMLNVIRRGSGRPLLLIHGLGGSWRSWEPVLPGLTARREIIAIDLPGHGATPAEPDSGTFEGLVRSVDNFLDEQDLAGAPVAGSSMGARLVLELARRGRVGASVSLNPGGFWAGWERTYFRSTLAVSIRLLRSLKPVLPALARHAATRTLLLAQLSGRPWSLSSDVVSNELCSFAETATFDALLRDLAGGPRQKGPAANASGPATIGWGVRDRLCPPRQAERARAAFPDAHLHWFNHSGHFPMWDQPQETVDLILART